MLTPDGFCYNRLTINLHLISLRSAKPPVSQFYYIASGDWLNNLFKYTGVFKSKKKSRG